MIIGISGIALLLKRFSFILAVLIALAPLRPALAEDATDLVTTLARNYPTLRSLVLVRGGCAVLEYYRKNMDAETRSPVHSVTKSVLSILVGIAIDEGYLRPDEKLSEIVPEAFDENVDVRVRDITVRDILTKTEGFAETSEGNFRVGPPGTELWRWMLNRPMKHSPGTYFRYDGVGSDLLAVVLSKAIKQDSAKFAEQRLLGPLQIRNYDWPADVQGLLHGETGLYLTARDMAKIGLLYLRNGRWGDRQVVSAAYVKDSTTRHNDGGPPVRTAYGYQWWISKTKNGFDSFFAAGRGSQLVYVVPQLDLVVAMAADGIPRGSQTFVNGVVIPALAGFPASTSCIAELGPRQP